MRVLVVEDEPVLADAIAKGLRWEGIAVDVASDGLEAVDRVAVDSYDVVLLDRDLPRLHGDEVCRRLAGTVDAPKVLMLTAAAEVNQRIEGLNLGADDYLGKPFSFGELIARVHALGRRTGAAHPPVLTAADVSVDSARRVAFRAGRRLDLSRKEFAVLEVLLAANGAVVSAEELLERVWDANTDPFTNAVRVTLAKLRRKLGDPPIIDTVVGVGYRVP